MTDSHELLADYSRSGSDAAFRELVTRYVDLVYSTALRLVDGDSHQAEDVAQTVFVALARTARTLPHDVKLGGWLHRHTCFVAASLMRGERRRLAREKQALEMNSLHSETNPTSVAFDRFWMRRLTNWKTRTGRPLCFASSSSTIFVRWEPPLEARKTRRACG